MSQRSTLRERVAELHPNRRVAWAAFGAVGVLLTLLHVFLNWKGIDSKELWSDEASTYVVSAYPPSRIASLSIDYHSQPPLYYLILHLLSFVSDGERFLRGFSWACCLALLGFVLAGLDELRLPARFAWGMLFVANDFTHYLAQEVRPYAFGALASFVSTVLLLRLLGSPTDRRLGLGYGLAVFATVTCLTWNAWVLVAHAVLIGLHGLGAVPRRGLRAALREWELPVVAAGAAALALALFVDSLRRSPAYAHRMKEAHSTHLLATLKETAHLDLYRGVFDKYAGVAAPFSWFLFALATYGLAVEARRRNPVVVLGLLMTFGQVAFVELVAKGHVAISLRYHLPAFAVFLFGVAIGVHHLLGRRPKSAAGVMLAVALGFTVHAYPAFAQSVAAPSRVDNWRRLHAALRGVPGKKAIFFDTEGYGQMLMYVARHDPDLLFLTNGYEYVSGKGIAAGGKTMTKEYVLASVRANEASQRCFFYALDRRHGSVRGGPATPFGSAFVPAMEAAGFRDVFTLSSERVTDPGHDFYEVHGFCRE